MRRVDVRGERTGEVLVGGTPRVEVGNEDRQVALGIDPFLPDRAKIRRLVQSIEGSTS